MIYFVGEKDNGYFVPEVAEKYGEECKFSDFIGDINEMTRDILKAAYSTVILHIPSVCLIDYQNIGKICKNIAIANSNIRIIVMAECYNIHSKVIQAAISGGVRFFMLGNNAAVLKQELADALEDKTNIQAVFDSLPTEEQRNRKKDEIDKSFSNAKTIAIVGSQKRIGTTTQSFQIVKYLLLQGFKVCYIQMNSTEYVQNIAVFYADAVNNEDDGSVFYQNIEMYYRKEYIPEILSRGYDFYVYDFGSITDDDFTPVQYLEKDIRIVVCGAKANELPQIQNILAITSTSQTEYIFSFVTENDQKDILELMEDKKKHTHFTDYIPDPFSLYPISETVYSEIIKPEQTEPKQEKKSRFSFFKRKKV